MHESTVITYSSNESIQARNELFNIMNNYPATDDEKERSLALFVRGSLLARILAIADIYSKIVTKPGIIIDLGTWRGQTAVLCENLRAIHEPLHLNRRVVCFDTFEGYKGFTPKDKATSIHKDGTYDVGGGKYADFLSRLLVIHERNNVMGHNYGKHKVIVGDCRLTLPKFLKEYPNEIVSLAFFDVNSYDASHKAFDAIFERLIPGGIIAFWQLTRNVIPAEGMVYVEQILNKYNHELLRSPIYPGLCYLIKR